MRKYLIPYAIIGIGAIFYVTYALAGEIKISITGAQGTVERAFQISNANIARIIQAYTAVNTTLDEDGNPAIPTPAEVIAIIARGTVHGIANNAIRWHQEQAAKTAVGAIAPIEATEP